MGKCDTCGKEQTYDEWKESGGHSEKIFVNGVKSLTFCSEECKEENIHVKAKN